MIFPCEKAVWYLLPQIRADLALELVATGMTQSEAAKRLGVTPAAVSQYIHKKRGRQLPRSQVYNEEIKAAVQKICEEASREELYKIVCNCCHQLQKEDADQATLCGKKE